MKDDPSAFEHRWERRLHDELRGLPEHEAPDNLVPNVMAVIRAREILRARTWYRRPFLLWPRFLRVAFGASAVAVFVLLAWSVPTLAAQLPGWLEPPVTVAQTTARLEALSDASRGLWDAFSLAATTFFTPARIAIVAGIVISQIALLGVGGSIWRNLLISPRRRSGDKPLFLQP